jgi:hypothetical protein
VQKLTRDLGGYLGLLGLSPRTYGSWVRAAHQAPWGVVSEPPKQPEDPRVMQEVVARLRQLTHKRHLTYDVDPIWNEYKGRMRRQTFRKLGRLVRQEYNAQLRSGIQRYEVTHVDAVHSLDYTGLPRELPGGPKRYLAKILDECTRFTLRKQITMRKGVGVMGRIVSEHLAEGKAPLVVKFDWEFAYSVFINLLLVHKVVPMPNPRRYPQFNGKLERSNRDLQLWFNLFESDEFWSYDELLREVGYCYDQIDRVECRENLGGLTREQAYRQFPRPPVDREQFFQDAVQLHRAILSSRPGVRVDPYDAWRVAAKETLKKYQLVRYGRP